MRTRSATAIGPSRPQTGAGAPPVRPSSPWPILDTLSTGPRLAGAAVATGGAAIGTLSAPPATSRPAPKHRSIWANLLATNEEMVHKMAEDTLGVVEHPIRSLGHMALLMVFPFLHPVAAVEQLVSNVKSDPLDGTCDAVGSVAGSAYLISVLISIGALAAAPFTGGASLALAAGAMAYGNVFGYITVGADAGGILLHEVRGADARTAADAKAQGDQTASYAEDESLNLITWNAGNYVHDLLGGGSGDVMQSNVAGNVIGSVGVYDAPPARFNWGNFNAHAHGLGGQAIQNRPDRKRAVAAGAIAN